jgi:uncharacterized sporulation protein YeaH/YhbH (DUF444 family)
MSHVIVDRRKNDKGKSSVNRRKFIGRVRDLLKESVKDTIKDGNLGDLAGGAKKKVRIPIRNLDEPWFHHDGTGINDIVRPGNDRFVPGDKIQRPKSGEGESGPKGSPDGESEDTFVFHLTKEEFLDLFFENCELPDLVKRNLSIVNEEELRRTGLTSDGAPATLNIERSMRRAKSRRLALRASKQRRLRELEEQLAHVLKKIDEETTERGFEVSEELIAEKQRLLHEIEVTKRLLKAVPFLDPIDLKYNHWSRVSIPTTQAVIFRVMDVSGSMSEHMKEMAKTFFILLQLFLEKHYTHIEIVNIKYHSVATETDEQDFFYGTDSGGTVTSKALQKVYDLIQERYPTSLWNIYVAHASDGDNFGYDNPEVQRLLTQQILPLVQYYAYVQINNEMSSAWSGHIHDPDNLWDLFETAKGKHRNLDCALVEEAKDVYPVFIKLFERRPS